MSVQTIGDEVDQDGYRLLIDGQDHGTLGTASERIVPELPEGSYEVELAAIASNCRVTNLGNPRMISVASGQTVDLGLIVFCLTPDAGRIFYVSLDGVVWTISAIGNNAGRVIEGRRLAVSADGRMIAFTGGAPEDIWIANADGSAVRNVTNTQNLREKDPAWSPDGQRIAYERSNVSAGMDDDIFVMNIDGSDIVNLTNNPNAGDADPEWSPDGMKIVFRSHRSPTPQGGLYIMNADGGDVTALRTGGPIPFLPDWSPDGTRIVYAGLSGDNFDIFAIETNGSNNAQMTHLSTTDGDPAWSPDGRWITFNSNRTGSFEIYVMRADGSDVVRLRPGQDPSWAP